MATIVHGQVVDEHGAPVAGAALGFRTAPGPLPDIGQLTDAEGRFTMALPLQGDYLLGARSDASGSGEARLAARGEAAMDVVIELHPPAGT